jgi:radical SAM protein with 4Fe4S-binding SPASM domain
MVSAEEMLERLEAQWNVPLAAGIEISDRCNEVCVHCYQEQGRKGEMTTEQLFGVMDELAAMGVLMLTLAGGEPTLRKDFLQLCEYADAKGFALRIFTNGLTMTRELAQALGKLAVNTVEISLYSTNSQTHEFVTGVPGSFERTVAGVRYLVEAGVSVKIKTPVMTLNEHETAEYAGFAKSLGAAYCLSVEEIMPREGGDRAPEMFQIAPAHAARLIGELDPRPPEAAVVPKRPLDTSPCGAGFGIHIEPNGALRPCTMLEVDFGNAVQDGVEASFVRSERARSMRRLTWATLHGCRECDLRSHCTHCFAASLTQTGDALGPYRGACQFARATYEARTGRAPRIIARAGDARDVGPYREITAGVFEEVPDVLTSDDEALAESLEWVRSSGGAVSGPGLVARPGELVQIRRPGRKKPKLERIPTRAQPARTLQAVPENIDSESASNAS